MWLSEKKDPACQETHQAWYAHQPSPSPLTPSSLPCLFCSSPLINLVVPFLPPLVECLRYPRSLSSSAPLHPTESFCSHPHSFGTRANCLISPSRYSSARSVSFHDLYTNRTQSQPRKKQLNLIKQCVYSHGLLSAAVFLLRGGFARQIWDKAVYMVLAYERNGAREHDIGCRTRSCHDGTGTHEKF